MSQSSHSVPSAGPGTFLCIVSFNCGLPERLWMIVHIGPSFRTESSLIASTEGSE